MAYAVKLTALRTQRVGAGLSVEALARRSNTSDLLITTLENGGSCAERDAQRLADALGVSTTTLGRQALS